MNPAATARELFLSERLAAQTRPLVPTLARTLRRKMDSTSGADLAAFFFRSGPAPAGVPERSGYYLGMRLAQGLARKHSLERLARLHGEWLRREIEQGLRTVESA